VVRLLHRSRAALRCADGDLVGVMCVDAGSRRSRPARWAAAWARARSRSGSSGRHVRADNAPPPPAPPHPQLPVVVLLVVAHHLARTRRPCTGRRRHDRPRGVQPQRLGHTAARARILRGGWRVACVCFGGAGRDRL
jgi:hypothetical protein